jgi:hypothetical protein
MDVSDILAAHVAKQCVCIFPGPEISLKLFRNPVIVEQDTSLEIDTGLLLVTDLNPIEEERYKCVSYFSSLIITLIP